MNSVAVCACVCACVEVWWWLSAHVRVYVCVYNFFLVNSAPCADRPFARVCCRVRTARTHTSFDAAWRALQHCLKWRGVKRGGTLENPAKTFFLIAENL